MMIESVLTLPLLLKAAPVLIPVTAKLAKHLFTTDNKLLSDLIELAIDKGEDATKEKLEAALKKKPDVVLGWHAHVFLDYTGWVLGQLVQHLAQQPQFGSEKAQLEQLAAQAPEGWKTFVLKGSPGLSPAHQDVFLRQMAAALARGEDLPPTDTVPFITFFNWHVRLSPQLQEKLATHLRTHLDNAIQLFLVSDYPQATQAYRQIILSGINNTQRMLRDMQAQLSQFSELLTDLRGSPGFDLDYYADKLLLHCERIPFSTKAETRGTQPITLSAVFVEPTLRAHQELDPDTLAASRDVQLAIERGEIDTLSPEQQLIARRLDERQRESPPVPAFQTLFDHSDAGHIVLAHAGVGKTSLVRRLALRWAVQQKNASVEGPLVPLPLLVELKTFASAYGSDRKLTLLDFIHGCEESIDRLDRLWCLHYLRTGAAVLILDGLDEVSRDETRLAIANGASRLRRLGVRVIVTSRRQGFIPRHWQQQTVRWSGWLLDEFSHPQRDAFIQLILPRLYASEGEWKRKQQELQRRFQHQPAIAQLSTNPLLLTLITVLQRTGRLGDNRIALYKEAAELLLDQWEAEHFGSDHIPQEVAVPCSAKTRREIVRRLAHKLIDPADETQECFAENLFGIGIFQDAIREVVDPRGVNPTLADQAANVLPNYLNERHSVICYAGQNEDTEERLFSFIHRTFLEYFIALALVQEVDNKSEEDTCHCQRFLTEKDGGGNPRWRDPRFENILPFYFGLFGELDRDNFLESRLPLLVELWDSDSGLEDRHVIPEEPHVIRHEAILFTASVWEEISERNEKFPHFGCQLREELWSLARWYDPDQGIHGDLGPDGSTRCRRAIKYLVRLFGHQAQEVQELLETVRNPDCPGTLCLGILRHIPNLQDAGTDMLPFLHETASRSNLRDWERRMALHGIGKLGGHTHLAKAIESLASIFSLSDLYLDGIIELADTDSLAALSRLRTLYLNDCAGLHGPDAFRGLASLVELREIRLRNCPGLKNTDDFVGLRHLQTLDLLGCTNLRGPEALAGLRELSSLEELSLDGCTGLTDTAALAGLSGLQTLFLNNCTGLQGLAALNGLRELRDLKELWLDGCTGLADTAALARLSGLRQLYLRGCTGLQGAGALDGVRELRGLEHLHLAGCTGLAPEDWEHLHETLGKTCRIFGW